MSTTIKDPARSRESEPRTVTSLGDRV
ncbi:MAG: hypothetical protein JWN84_1873, partial [Nocardioides sp.]|nr:hypothetical protein [Nocardioides sp.]